MMQFSIRYSAAAAAAFLLAALAAGPAAAVTVLYASPDGEPGHDGTTDQDPKRDKLQDAIRKAASIENEPVIIQLLTTKPGQPTTYRADDMTCAFRIEDIERRTNAPLTIRGVKSADGRWLTTIAGTSVSDIISHQGLCKIKRPLLASAVATPSHDDLVHTDDLLKATALIEASVVAGGLPGQAGKMVKAPLDQPTEGQTNRPAGEKQIAAIEDQAALTRCFHVRNSRWIIFENLHFKDCWLPAIYTADSKNITLKGSMIEGSSYVVFAVATPKWSFAKLGRATNPADSSGFVVEDNVWFQDTSGFGPDQEESKCHELNAAEDCPGDMWSRIPWGVTHDTLYEHMNGALFGSINIAGGVTIRRNVIRYAYNGVRMVTDDHCEKDFDCFSNANANVTVAENDFAFIRDNPVEPEGRAQNWRIHGNDIQNAHAWFSLDNVRDGPVYIWGNTGWWNSRPAVDCQDLKKWREPQRVDFERGGYKKVWPKPGKKLESMECSASRRGTVMKVGDDQEQREKHIYIFHNSWRVRAPILSDGMTGTLHHWNNAILFTGCGPTGDKACRVGPDDCDNDALGEYFTSGNRSVVFNCVVKARVGDPNAFDYRHDISNQALPEVLVNEPRPPAGKDGFELGFAEPEKGNFKIRNGSDLIGAACLVAVKEGALVCEQVEEGQRKVDVGAFTATGARYEAPPMPEPGPNP